MTFLRASALVALFMMFGRISGFVREIVIAQTAGASVQSDVAIVLLTFPDLMISLLLGGGLAAALVPAFKAQTPELARALFVRVAWTVAACFVAIAALVVVLSGPVLSLIAPGLDAATQASAIPSLRLASLALPLGAVSGVMVAYLNSREQFIFSAPGTLVFNLTLILVLLIMGQDRFIAAMVCGILLGGMVRFAFQWWGTRGKAVRPDYVTPISYHPILVRFLSGFGFFSVLALLPPIARAFASLEGAGALSLFNYAYKLVELPMAVIVSGITTVLLPRLSQQVKDDDLDSAREHITQAIRTMVGLLTAIAIVIFWFADSITSIVYGVDTFGVDQALELHTIVAIGFVGLPLQGCVLLLGTVFVAFDRIPLLIAGAGVMLTTLAVFALILQPLMSLSGVMWAYVAAQTAGFLFLLGQVGRVIGIRTFRVFTSGGVWRFVAPIGFCIIVSYFSDLLGGSIWVRFGFACAALTSFMLVALAVQPELRIWLSKKRV